MLGNRGRRIGWIAAAVLFGAFSSANVAFSQNQEPAQNDPNQEVLTRGPVHEAFAEPTVFDNQQGVVVPKEPPQEVEEIPPAEKPEGDVIWIPGYWNFDDERQDFVWVSGIWRNAPPNLRWVPGYWHRTGAGFQWTSGFWQSAATEEVQYLEKPPASLENGPPTPQPTQQHFWVPGNWYWTSNRYAWRAGYWSVSQPDWVWAPASYYWTPSGYVYNEGYWDYPLATRGLMFAPVYFAPGYVARRPIYTPSVVIQTPALMVNFFARPRYRHYYFGDYYAPVYVERGYRPWFRSDRVSYRYDPLYTYYSVTYGRTDRLWRTRMVERYDRLVIDTNLRPPRTYAAQQIAVQSYGRRGTTVDVNIAVGTPLAQVAVAGGVRFEKMSAVQRQQTAAVAVQANKFRDQRVKLESTPNLARVNGVPGAQPKTVRLTDAPIVDPGIRAGKGTPSVVRTGEKAAVGAKPNVNAGTTTGVRPDRGNTGVAGQSGVVGKTGVGKSTTSETVPGRSVDLRNRTQPTGKRSLGNGGGEKLPGSPDTGVNTGNPPTNRPGTPPAVRPGMQPGNSGSPTGVRPQPGTGRPERRTPPPPPTTERGRTVGESSVRPIQGRESGGGRSYGSGRQTGESKSRGTSKGDKDDKPRG